MTFRMLYVAIYLALALPVAGRQHKAITNAIPVGPTGWSVVRSAKASRRESFDEEVDEQTDEQTASKPTSRANCVAWKDARFLNYPNDALYQYGDFASKSDADTFFKAKKDFGQLATVQYADGAQVDTYGSYFTHDAYNMALVCGISLNMTTPWATKTSCASGEAVDTMGECQIAGPFLGFKYKGHVSTDDGNTPPGCYSVGAESFYNSLASATFTGSASGSGAAGPICRVTTTTTTPLPTTLYAGHLSKLASFTSTQYDGFTGSVSLELTVHGVGTEVKITGRHNAATRAALRSSVFHAHLHAAPCASNGGGHYQNPNGDGTANDVNENWPWVTCDDNADCFGKAHNAWAPRQADLAAGMSIVVHDTPNGGSKAFCADLTLCPSHDVHACLSATAQLISAEPEAPVVLKAESTTAAAVLKVETAVTTTALAVKPPSTTAAPVALKEEPCNDANEFCGDWSAKGECGKNPGYMHVVCKAACNQCRGAPQQPVLAQKK